ncbi:tail fiber protein [Flammeovirga sp. SJP92]|uniref:tail fiber protein n=1 Tax=Flammeovirga sp. SJP92 TaxID=1775430 RepID=UPI000788D8B0|nr:tail fiber protein [Flammeovirga sp. SJP92]KXX71264.1 hypothetical protein AVL50_09410 [Flammeovirga sp. SJP92]
MKTMLLRLQILITIILVSLNTYGQDETVNGNLDVKKSITLGGTGEKLHWGWPDRSIEQYSSDDKSMMIRFKNSMSSSYGNADGGFEFTDHTGKSVLRINNYKVGIGTDSPKSLLFIKQSSETSNSGLSIQDLATRTINIYGEGASGRQVISTTGTNNPLAFILNGTEVMRMDYRGHVGIGTITPTSKFLIKQSTEKESTSGLSIQDLATRTINIYGEGAAGRQVISTTGTNNPLAFILNGTEAMRMDYRGHVGIGTTNLSDFKLSVKGKIRAEEVKVYTGWADYVFEEDYNLKTLSEVEAHIKEHKHLPDVPSAKEVEENGVNVGETEAMLLRKIEELTLYTIEQEKEISNLKNELREVQDLKNELKSLKEMIQSIQKN